jgi:hypothetical protein
MGRRNNIAVYFLTLLLAFCSQAKTGGLYASHHTSAYSSAHLIALAKYANAPLELKSPVIRKDWIKVRYMGGECGYDAAVFHLVINPAEYIDYLSANPYDCFFSSQAHFLFKLRGPPSVIA